MKTYLAKYGEAFTVPFSLYEVDGVHFRTDAVGDVGDIRLTRNEGAEGATTNEFVDEGTGYSVVLTIAEMSFARIHLFIVDQTGTKVWLDDDITIMTFGHASSQYPNIGLQTGDSFARIGAAGAGLTSLAQAITALSNVDWTNARSGYLDELNAPNIPADIDTLLARLTALRAGYLDNLSAGAVALDSTGAKETTVSAIPTNPLLTDDSRLDNLDATISSRSSHSAADIWAVVSRTITGGIITTNNDKTGYLISGSKTTLDALNDFNAATETVDMDRILGTLLTESNAGNVADNVSYFYDVEPTTIKTVNDVGVAGAGLTAQQVWEYVTRTLTAGTKDTEIDAIKAITDVIPNNGEMSSIAQDSTVAKDTTVAKETTLNSVGVIVTAIEVDTGTTLPAQINGVETKVDLIPTTPMRGTDGANTVEPDPAGTAATPAEVNAEVLDVLTVDTFAEPGKEIPAATNTIVGKLGYLFKFLRNRSTNDGSLLKLYDDAGTIVDQQAPVSDDTVTADKGKWTIGS